MEPLQVPAPGQEPQVTPSFTPQAATLYRAAVSLGTAETQLIWTRYTGFIVMNGFLVNVLAAKWTQNEIAAAAQGNSILLTLVGVLALLLNSTWHVLNFCGWLNQNVCYRKAYLVFARPMKLVTDQFDEPRSPSGWIYWISQFIPTLFSLGAAMCLGFAAAEFWKLSNCGAVMSAAVLWGTVAVVSLVLEYAIIKPRVWRDKGGEVI